MLVSARDIDIYVARDRAPLRRPAYRRGANLIGSEAHLWPGQPAHEFAPYSKLPKCVVEFPRKTRRENEKRRHEKEQDALAQHLKIRVKENGQTKVQITFHAAVIENLETLIADEIKERIERQGVKLSELVDDVRRRCYAPGDVFQLTDGSRQASAWLK